MALRIFSIFFHFSSMGVNFIFKNAVFKKKSFKPDKTGRTTLLYKHFLHAQTLLDQSQAFVQLVDVAKPLYGQIGKTILGPSDAQCVQQMRKVHRMKHLLQFVGIRHKRNAQLVYVIVRQELNLKQRRRRWQKVELGRRSRDEMLSLFH